MDLTSLNRPAALRFDSFKLLGQPLDHGPDGSHMATGPGNYPCPQAQQCHPSAPGLIERRGGYRKPFQVKPCLLLLFFPHLVSPGPGVSVQGWFFWRWLSLFLPPPSPGRAECMEGQLEMKLLFYLQSPTSPKLGPLFSH